MWANEANGCWKAEVKALHWRTLTRTLHRAALHACLPLWVARVRTSRDIVAKPYCTWQPWKGRYASSSPQTARCLPGDRLPKARRRKQQSPWGYWWVTSAKAEYRLESSLLLPRSLLQFLCWWCPHVWILTKWQSNSFVWEDQFKTGTGHFTGVFYLGKYHKNSSRNSKEA